MPDDSQKEMPVSAVVAVLMLLVAGFGWGFAAGLYKAAHDPVTAADAYEESRSSMPRRRGFVGRFVGTAIGQLPNAPAVVGDTLGRHPWLPITLLVLEVGVLFGGWKMKQLEAELAEPEWKRRRRTSR